MSKHQPLWLQLKMRRAVAKYHKQCDQASGTLFKANLISFREFERIRKKLDVRKREYEVP